ncbi:hypothetical protein DFH06DRAFT_1344840 [Mycena polygramma]|nr:hypothetical protein DFH06DRAFT_1344840 [Mycena polygramma]
MKGRLGAPLPPGWERRTDVAEGRTYYFDRNTHTATYKRPHSSYVPGPPVPAAAIAPATNSENRLPESSANPAMLPRNADDDAQSDWTDVTDDYDEEYQQKYSTDLDTSLIFAGLFSAVTSAFIIQIQPEIKAHGTPSSEVVAQCLLYSSLSLTLLAALLAVLGKQSLRSEAL